MNTTMSLKTLEEVLDLVTRDVTRRATGISLFEGGQTPKGTLYTVYAEFNRGYHTGVSLCADASLFTRLTRHMMQADKVSPQDIEDFSKEYFNVLCGQIAVGIFRVTRVALRFTTPAFCRGRYVPAGHDEYFILRYISDAQENAQLSYHTPSGASPQ